MIKQEGRPEGIANGAVSRVSQPLADKGADSDELDQIPTRDLGREEVRQVKEKDPDIDGVDHIQPVIGRAKPA